ncbi:MAG: CHC2 zinc finger domain-containing protein [Paludibacter sp.]|nr:CHC2 zinc finger domain-containing protein [Paludibacter sp.]
MNYYKEEDKQRILDATNDRLVEVISDFVNLTQKGNKYFGDCPSCGKERGLEINPQKKIFKCFKCGQVGGNNSVSFLMKAQNKTFPEALEYLQHKFSIVVDTPNPAKPKKAIKQKKSESYCESLLRMSGLTQQDVQATVFVQDTNKTVLTSRVFKSGTVDSFFRIVEGDDVIIEYYDLEGAPVKYEVKEKKKPTGVYKEFFRIRYQFPDEHKDSQGKPCKYKSPYGSGNFIYIPEKIRELYRSGQNIERLFLQEGEKKAEKACKHGVHSVGLAGINNIAMDGRLPEDLIRIIQKLKVKEVILVFDSDWNDISKEIKINDSVDKRPRNFFYAARNFKDYMRALKNREIYVDIYIGHVKQNEKEDKGIDDLLTNTLKNNESELQSDIEYLINEKNLSGQYLQLFKITSWTDNKLEELWSLNNPQEFAKAHSAVLKHLPEFRINRHVWRFNDKQEIESAQPIEADEKYWDESVKTDKGGNERTVYDFKYGRCFTFLQNRGFGRYRKPDGNFQFIQIEHPVVKNVDHNDVRDFVIEFTKVVANENVLEMLYRGGVQYLGPDKLSNLNWINPNFEDPTRDSQRFYFKNKCWEVTSGEIKELEYTGVSYNIWTDQKHDFPAVKHDLPVIDVSLNDGEFDYSISPYGKKCQFLQFLINASNFTWRKEEKIRNGDLDIRIDPEELYENKLHLISKLAAIGYMLMSAKDRSIARAVVAMDGMQSEVGQSRGRTGKSLIGELFKQVVPSIYINGKKGDLETDTFIWDELTEKTKIVFMDDVRTNFNLEFLFANITGDWAVNYKGGRRMTIPFHKSPKIYITTNHALNGEGSSFTDRQYIIAFSDWYNDTHKPIDDFGNQFFDEWDFEQWNLLWNLMANCVQVYLKYGVIQAPQERIAIRQQRQKMGETFITWAEEYFSDESKLGQRLVKKNIYEDFIKSSNVNLKYEPITIFKKKIQSFCKWKGFIFNPHMYDSITGLPLRYDKDGQPILDDKSGGVEYLTVAVSGYKTIFTESESGELIPENDDKPF